jgi:Xaa-Pro aminopeptidase
MENKQLDGFLVTDEINILYFADFLNATQLLIPSNGANILYVYGVNYQAAMQQAKNCQVELVRQGEDADKKAMEQIKKFKVKRLGFDTMDVSTFSRLNLKGISLKPNSQLIWELRKVKDEIELDSIRKAAELTDIGAKTASEIIKAGMHEYEVAAEVEYAMRKLGSEGVAFDTIVASGLRSAFPHGGCTDKKLKKGELILFDIGARYQNYRVDLTRTFLVGKPTSEQEKIYNVVMEAQEKAFKNIKDGVSASNVDAVARQTIETYNYGEYFVHSLGHGVGLAVHEPPILNPASKDILKTGNVVTDEPGIYIPNFGGVRIEDTVLVKNDGAEKLTKANYDIIVE